MRIGIVSSQRNPPDAKGWMRFHVDVGIDAFYIVIEDTPGLGATMAQYADELTARVGRPITVHYEDAAPVDRSTEDNFTDILTRQSDRVDKMMALARSQGVEWLFHIDDDELLYPGNQKAISTWKDVLAEVPASCASIHMQNWEGFSPVQPTSSWLTDSAVQYLPQACAHQFAAYVNGKSASRTTVGQSAHGVHHFKGGKECELDESKGVVLHHEALAMGPNDKPPERWIQKNLLRVKDDMDKIPFVATHDAVAAVKSGDETEMSRVWQKYRSVDGERFKACPTPMVLTLPSHKWGTF